MEDVYADWPMGEDLEEHASKLQELLDAGATRLFVHSARAISNGL